MDVEDLLIGKWEQLIINDGIGTFSKVKKLEDKKYAIVFKNATDMYEWAGNCCDSLPTEGFAKVPATYTIVDSILKFSTWNSEVKILDITKDDLTIDYQP